jgi:hypothetical protein
MFPICIFYVKSSQKTQIVYCHHGRRLLYNQKHHMKHGGPRILCQLSMNLSMNLYENNFFQKIFFCEPTKILYTIKSTKENQGKGIEGRRT